LKHIFLIYLKYDLILEENINNNNLLNNNNNNDLSWLINSMKEKNIILTTFGKIFNK
jgi:hypothetical protein